MRIGFVAIAALVFLAPDAYSQGVDITNQTKIFGNLDWPPNWSVMSQSAGIAFHGWAMSCYTSQQPADVELWYTKWDQSAPPVRLTPGKGIRIVPRRARPDVTAYMVNVCLADPTKVFWGWEVHIDAAIPLGPMLFALRFYDPIVGIGVLDVRQVPIVVVP